MPATLTRPAIEGFEDVEAFAVQYELTESLFVAYDIICNRSSGIPGRSFRLARFGRARLLPSRDGDWASNDARGSAGALPSRFSASSPEYRKSVDFDLAFDSVLRRC